jgi:preprotein translocase subunit SecF
MSNNSFAFKLKVMNQALLWVGVGVAVMLFALLMLFIKGLHLGIDFTGGTNLLLRFDQTPKIITVREALKKSTIHEIDRGSSIQYLGEEKDISIKTKMLTPAEVTDLQKVLEKELGKFKVMEISTIGATVGHELRQQSFWIILLVTIALLSYITIRFQFFYGVAAIFALLHDGLLTLGFAAMTQMDVDLTFVAAVLTILGYSINDTIVIFDRLRENQANPQPGETLIQIANRSVSETLTRSINTVMTVLIVLACLYVFGGSTVKDFNLVLLVGIGSGCYSSIFIATPLYIKLKQKFSKTA